MSTSTIDQIFMQNLDELTRNNDQNLSDELKYLLNKLDKESFLKKLRHSIDIIRNAIELSNENNELCISFNGGKDCCVVLYLFYIIALHDGYIASTSTSASTKTRKLNILIMKLNEQFSELDEFIENLFQNYYSNKDINLIVLQKPGLKLKKCLELFKETYSNMLYILMGTRRTDNQYVMKIKDFEPTDPDWPYFIRVNPILDWNYTEIWFFIKSFNVPYCSLYDLGYTSLGDSMNTIKNEALFDSEKGVYKPAYMLENDYNERNSRI